MSLIDTVIAELPAGRVLDVAVGPTRPCVEVETAGVRRCGLASWIDEAPPAAEDIHWYVGQPVSELTAAAGRPEKHALSSVGVAAMNALIPPPVEAVEKNAETQIEELAGDGVVALIGHFHFAERLRRRVGRLEVIERAPLPGDRHEREAPEIIPQADVVAATAMTIVNGSIDGILELCRPQTTVMLLGPSTPLSPILFDLGIDVLSGAVVTDCDAVRSVLPAARSFRDFKHNGVKLVTLSRV